MIKNKKTTRCFAKFSVCSFILCIGILSANSQGMSKKNMGTLPKDTGNMQNKMMLPMAFFTHMGMPLNVGTYGLRVAALAVQNDGKTKTEFNFQFETGLSKTVGLFLGGEGLFEDPTLEAMFQFLVWKSKNGMNGFSPIIEFEFPLGKEAKRTVYTLVGVAATISNAHLAYNQVIHYSPLEDLAEGSGSLVAKVSKRVFLVSEISGVVQKDEQPIFNLLAGVKVKLNRNILLGFAYQLPLTSNRNYSSRYVFQPNLMLQK